MGSGLNPVNAVNMEGKIKEELDTAHLDRVALQLEFARDFYLLADEFLSSPLVVQWVAEFLSLDPFNFLFVVPVNASSS